jgi:hypothetical protein
MRVTLTKDVETSYTKTAKGGFSKAAIHYQEGQKPFNLVSFKNPAVFEAFKTAKAGQAFEVESVKGDDGFYQWTSAKEVTNDAPAASVPGNGKPAWTPGADPRETKEERAARQRLIVRQSSLSNAIEFLKNDDHRDDVSDLLELADRFTAWVYEAPDLFDEPNDLTGA